MVTTGYLQLWPWLLVISGVFLWDEKHSINLVLLVLITGKGPSLYADIIVAHADKT